MEKPPFEPDKNPKKIAVAGKKGYGPSAATHLAKQGMKKMIDKKDMNEMDKSAPQPGRDGKVSHSTYGSRDKKGSDYFKGKEAPGKPITKKQMEKDALDILKKQGVAEGLNEAVHPDAVHVSMVKKDGKPMYKVHKVGLNFSDKIKKGEHLSDTDLDDFSDMGGMVKHIKESKTLKELLAIFEGRGRPRKNPDDPKWQKAPTPAKKSGGEEEEEDEGGPERPDSPHMKTEPDQHISVQLKKAVDAKDEKGGADVKFANGKTHFVKHDVAHKVLSALDKLKPADRGNVHDHIAQSHDNLMAVHKIL